jgi:hypothetical protein
MTAAPRPVKHGSYAGYQWHKKHGEEACPDCLRGNADYHHQWRHKTPAALDKQAVGQKRRTMATQELIRRHQDEFNQILADIDRVVVKRRPKRNAA